MKLQKMQPHIAWRWIIGGLALFWGLVIYSIFG